MPLTELDANEWFDVYRQFLPDATREEFDARWAEFQQAKAMREKARKIQ